MTAATIVVTHILETLVLAFVIYLCFAHIFTWYYFGSYERIYRSSGDAPPVSIIKPVKGLDPFAFDNFQSFCEQDYQNSYEVLFCVDDQNDPAVPVIKSLIKEHRHRHLRLLFTDPLDTQSFGKIKKMITGLAASSYDEVIFCNADVHVRPDFLRDTIPRLNDGRIGLAISATAYEGAENVAAACWNLSTAALVVRLASACLFRVIDVVDAKIMIVRKQVLDDIGGLEQFGRQADDGMTLARAIRNRGYYVHLLKEPARVWHPYDSWSGWSSHWHRWLVLARHYLPAPLWPLSFTQVPLWWSLLYTTIAVVHGEGMLTGVIFSAASIVAGMISAAIINLMFVQDKKMWRFIWVVPILQLSSLPLLLRSCLTDDVVWRGTRLRVNPDCTITERET
jgi:ceramide glucosyltransferase